MEPNALYKIACVLDAANETWGTAEGDPDVRPDLA